MKLSCFFCLLIRDKIFLFFLFLRAFCPVLCSLHQPTWPCSISYPPERQSSSCPQPIIHHCVLWVWAQEKSNEQQSYLSASRGSKAEFKLVMNLIYEQQVLLKLTYGLALQFNVLLCYYVSIHHILKSSSLFLNVLLM